MNKRALASQEQQAQAQRISRLGRSLLMLLATVLTFGTFALVAADQLYRPDTFVIDQLKIKGSFRYLQPQQIEAAVNQQEVGNFFSIELSSIKQRVESLAWVQSAEIRREWPNTLLIEVVEQQPVMRFNADRWVNLQGEVIDLPESVAQGQTVTLTGKEKDSAMMLQQAYRWKQQLLESGLELIGLTLTARRAYGLILRQISTESEFEVLLGRDEVEQRLARFQMLFDGQYRLSDQQLQRVDARYPNGLAVKSVPRPASDVIAVNQPELASSTGNR